MSTARTGATSLGASRINHLDLPSIARDALAEGVIVRYSGAADAENHDVKLPSLAASEAYQGLAKEGGGPTAGSGVPTSENPDAVDIQTQGQGIALLAANKSVLIGDPIEASNTSGHAQARTRWGTSGPVLGFSRQRKTAGASPTRFEVNLVPHYVEIVQPITGGSEGSAIGAATKYLAAPGVAVAAAQIPLFVARKACVLRDLAASLKTAPGGADTAIFTVQKSSDNGATWSDTALTCTISAAAKAASDLTNAVNLAVGDLVAIKVVSSAGTAAGPTATVSAT